MKHIFIQLFLLAADVRGFIYGARILSSSFWKNPIWPQQKLEQKHSHYLKRKNPKPCSEFQPDNERI